MKLDEWSKRYLSPESPVIALLGRYADLIILNILWIVCSLPVITVGAASTALYNSAAAVRKDGEKPVRLFLNTFRRCFVKATGAFLVCVVLTAMTAGVFWMALRGNGPVRIAVLALGIFAGLLLAFWMSFLFPTVARFDSSLQGQMKLALLTALGNLDTALCMGAVHLAPIVLMLFFYDLFVYTIPGWILIGFSLIAVCDSWLCDKAFDRIADAHK